MATTPLSRPIPYTDPIAVYTALAGGGVAALLDSAGQIGDRGRYSFIAFDPYRVLRADPESLDPFESLARALEFAPFDADPELPPFQGGAVGYLGYEMGRHLERVPPSREKGSGAPDMVVGLYDTVVSFDHEKQKAWLVAADLDDARPAAETRLETAEAQLRAAPPLADIDWSMTAEWTLEVPPAEYKAMVQRAIDYIYAGDIFQANITQRFLATKPTGLRPFELFRRLRTLSANPYGAFLDCGDGLAVASASPEMFLRLEADGRISTRPIKGTRPRGDNAVADQSLAEALQASPKDRAENLMIVDLMRNDIGRVCRIGSVGVPELCALETFPSVHHLVSEINGALMPGIGPLDVLCAAFPGGSITGAPKVRAMEIIHELEPARRGPYCGTIAWIGADGAMESSIVIRTLVIEGNQVIAQAGGGIVADSVPAEEYAESLDKAGVLLSALNPDWRAEDG